MLSGSTDPMYPKVLEILPLDDDSVASSVINLRISDFHTAYPCIVVIGKRFQGSDLIVEAKLSNLKLTRLPEQKKISSLNGLKLLAKKALEAGVSNIPLNVCKIQINETFSDVLTLNHQ